MVAFGTNRLIQWTGSWPVLLASSLLLPSQVNAQNLQFAQAPALTPPANVEPLSPSIPASGLFSIPAGKTLMAEAEGAVAGQNYKLAAQKLQDARQLMNQLSNYYQALTSSFLGVDNQASDSHRRKALESAQLRDQATFQLALVYRAQNQPELAIPLLIEIIRSQNPTRELGQKAYQQLLELGFVDVPFPRQRADQAPAPRPANPAPPAPATPAQPGNNRK